MRSKIPIFILLLLTSYGISSCVIGGNVAPPPASPTPIELPTNFTIGEVTLSSASLDRIISSETVTLPNCEGTSELTVRRSFTQDVERIPQIRPFDTAALDVSVETAVVEVKVKLGIDTAEESPTISETYELEMSSAPGSSVSYTVNWVLVSKAGVLEVIGENDVQFIEFTIPDSLHVEIGEPEQVQCATTEANS